MTRAKPKNPRPTLAGEAAPTILTEVQRSGADLIVMSTHGRSGIGRWIYGSVADALMRQSAIPILLIPANCGIAWSPEGPKRILVPLDGSALSENVLGPAADLAAAGHAELVLLRVVEPHPMAYADPSALVWIDQEPEREAARAYVKVIAEKLRQPGQSVRTTDALGYASWHISEVAQEAKPDLIAISTHGRGGVSRFVMGSVARPRRPWDTLAIRPPLTCSFRRYARSTALSPGRSRAL